MSMPAVPPAAVCSRPSTSHRSVAGIAPSFSSGSRKAQWIAARSPRSRSAAASTSAPLPVDPTTSAPAAAERT